jgi:hypothetical protein
MDKANKAKVQKSLRRANVLESIKDIGSQTSKTIKQDVLKQIPEDFFEQLIGTKPQEKKFSGDITPGESLDFNEAFSGKHEENQKLKNQISLERKLAAEEKAYIQEKTNQLRLQLHAIMQEILNLAKTTQNLGEQVEVASMQAPIEPGIYHLIFFEKLLEFIKSFRKKIENTSVWLKATNSRAQKKNFWGTYKKQGSKFFLSSEHYLQRSAG